MLDVSIVNETSPEAKWDKKETYVIEYIHFYWRRGGDAAWTL